MEDRPATEETDPPTVPRHEQQGGEAVCWLVRVCAECGRLNEVDDPVSCEYCGACFPT